LPFRSYVRGGFGPPLVSFLVSFAVSASPRQRGPQAPHASRLGPLQVVQADVLRTTAAPSVSWAGVPAWRVYASAVSTLAVSTHLASRLKAASCSRASCSGRSGRTS